MEKESEKRLIDKAIDDFKEKYGSDAPCVLRVGNGVAICEKG